MLVSALPHEQETSPRSSLSEIGDATIPVINADVQVLPERDFSDVVERDNAAFNARHSDKSGPDAR